MHFPSQSVSVGIHKVVKAKKIKKYLIVHPIVGENGKINLIGITANHILLKMFT